nr:MAG TPA: hypothetical protein [Caudoviricetes sp.]
MNSTNSCFYSNRNIKPNQHFREFCFYFLLEWAYKNTKKSRLYE